MDWAEVKARIQYGEDGSTEFNAYILTEEQTIAGAGVSDVDLPVFQSYLKRQGFEVVTEPQPAVEDDLKNEQMANYMLDRQYMERRGRGWLVMHRAMQEFNGTEPEIEHDAESRFVTVRFKLSTQPSP